jgi:hypothetical protein
VRALPASTAATTAAGPYYPCDGCFHNERCKQGLACAVLSLFVRTGRISPIAPRDPRRATYLRLFGRRPRPNCLSGTSPRPIEALGTKPRQCRYPRPVEAKPRRQIADGLNTFPEKAAEDGPCSGCRHYQRCTDELICCEAFALFARLKCGPERWRWAPRQPSAAILDRLSGVPRATVRVGAAASVTSPARGGRLLSSTPQIAPVLEPLRRFGRDGSCPRTTAGRP